MVNLVNVTPLFHVQRSNYVNSVRYRQFDPEVLSPSELGWKEERKLHAIMTDQLPEYSIEMSVECGLWRKVAMLKVVWGVWRNMTKIGGTLSCKPDSVTHSVRKFCHTDKRYNDNRSNTVQYHGMYSTALR